jgi:hypothetical protein
MTQISPIAQIEALYARLGKARELVAQGKVSPVYGIAEYYVVEGSSTKYLINGSCNCPDATNRSELIKGLCKHRLAAMVFAERQGKTESPQVVESSLRREDEELAREVADLYR